VTVLAIRGVGQALVGGHQLVEGDPLELRQSLLHSALDEVLADVVPRPDHAGADLTGAPMTSAVFCFGKIWVVTRPPKLRRPAIRSCVLEPWVVTKPGLRTSTAVVMLGLITEGAWRRIGREDRLQARLLEPLPRLRVDLALGHLELLERLEALDPRSEFRHQGIGGRR
jgi:hypothetical protein